MGAGRYVIERSQWEREKSHAGLDTNGEKLPPFGPKGRAAVRQRYYPGYIIRKRGIRRNTSIEQRMKRKQ